MSRRRNVWLSQHGVWDTDLTGRESMPLACASIKAYAETDEDIRREMNLRIFNFSGPLDPLMVIRRMFADEVPDVLALSIFGWNYSTYGRVAETFRQLNPSGWIIMGGTHVANQASRVFGQFPAVDVIANGEGERTFRDLLRAHLAGRSRHDLSDIDGVSFKSPQGEITTTKLGERLALHEIPSPFLSGAMELAFPDGRFRYDVALIETNRGCPYACSFCYWGGAIGTKLRKFTLERLRAEIDLFARYQVANIVLCDSNFGMTEADEEFVEIMIKAREKYGFPRSVVTSWAKNKGKPFYRIVSRMKEKGLHSSFTLALQSLHPPALERMSRKNMKVNDWEDLASWLQKGQFDVYGELIWGCPGETFDSFLEGYDKLASVVSRIAVYPLLLIPNTEFAEEASQFKFITWRGGKDDFEYILSHETMSYEDNQRMHRLLFWMRIVGEYYIFRYCWLPLRKLVNITHSQVFMSLDAWLDRQSHTAEGKALLECRAAVADHLDAYAIERGLNFFYTCPGLGAFLQRWWEEEIVTQATLGLQDFLRELFRYDWLTLPVFHNRKPGLTDNADGLPDAANVTFDREEYYVHDMETTHDVPAVVSALARNEAYTVVPLHRTVKLHYKKGFEDYYMNHEFNLQYVGKTMDQLVAARAQAYEINTANPIPAGADEAERELVTLRSPRVISTSEIK